MDSRLPPDPIYVFRGTTSSVNVIKFAPVCVSDCGLLVAGSSKGIISLWDLKTKRVSSSLDSHDGKGILGLEITSNSKLISHGRDGFINTWDLGDGGLSHTTKLACPVFGFCKFSTLQKDDKLWLATASEQQSQIDVLNLDSKECIHRIKCEANVTYGMCMCVKLFLCPGSHQPKILAGYEDGFIRLWDVTSGKMESQLKVHSETVMCMDLDEKQLKVVTGSADDKLVVSDFSSQNTLTIHKSVELKKPGVASVKIRNDSKLLSVGSWDGRIRVYSWKTLKPLAVLNYHSETVNSLDFSAYIPENGTLMAAASKDCRISLWSLYNDR